MALDCFHIHKTINKFKLFCALSSALLSLIFLLQNAKKQFYFFKYTTTRVIENCASSVCKYVMNFEKYTVADLHTKYIYFFIYFYRNTYKIQSDSNHH